MTQLISETLTPTVSTESNSQLSKKYKHRLFFAVRALNNQASVAVSLYRGGEKHLVCAGPDFALFMYSPPL
jgi:hypothetical protein